MATQTGAWLEKAEQGATVQIRHDMPISQPGVGQVLIKLTVTGICHTDLHSIYGETPMDTNVAGHEGVGRIVGLGEGVDSSMLGKAVGVKWLYSACGGCEICRVKYQYCPHQENSGRSVPGTFQQYMVAPLKHLTMIPAGLKPEIVAPLLCAGLTMYSAVAKLGKFCTAGDTVVIIGAGGGLGHLGVQIASAKGYRVVAIDSGEKEEICKRSGAVEFINMREQKVEDAVKAGTNGLGAHGVIVTAGSEKAYRQVLGLLRPLGTAICVGIPQLDFHLLVSPFEMIVKGLNILGSSVGDEDDLHNLLILAVQGVVLPQIETFKFESINEVLGKLARFEIQGRVVLQIPQRNE